MEESGNRGQTEQNIMYSVWPKCNTGTNSSYLLIFGISENTSTA